MTAMFKASTVSGAYPKTRLGVLSLGEAALATPAFIVPTTRGAVPHLTTDNQTAATVPAAGVYVEEMIDFNGPVMPVLKHDALPLINTIFFVAVRSPGSARGGKANGSTWMNISTHQGFQKYSIEKLARSISSLRPSLVAVPHDAAAQSPGDAPGSNRVRKMKQRGLDWLDIFGKERAENKDQINWPLLATLTPELAADAAYVGELVSRETRSGAKIDGVYLVPSDAENAKASAIRVPANYDGLRVCGALLHPVEILDHIAQGIDLFYAWTEQYTDRGLALNFTLDSDTPSLVLDLNDSRYQSDMSLLGSTGHALAYVHHLLKAKEMTAQVLLQKHNLEVFAQFFSDIRKALATGTLAAKHDAFAKRYGSEP